MTKIDRTEIYCCGCRREVSARLTDGREIYPRRRDLHDLPFWKCDACKNYVGCHFKTNKPTKPLGCIPTNKIRTARQHIHNILDPLWKTGKVRRKEVYSRLSTALGRRYHTADLRSLDEARVICQEIETIYREQEKG